MLQLPCGILLQNSGALAARPPSCPVAAHALLHRPTSMSQSLREAMARGRSAQRQGGAMGMNMGVGVQMHEQSLRTTLRQARASGVLKLIDKGLDAVPHDVCAIADLHRGA